MKHSGKTPGRGGKKSSGTSFGGSSDRPSGHRGGRPRSGDGPGRGSRGDFKGGGGRGSGRESSRDSDRGESRRNSYADPGYRPRDDKKARRNGPPADERSYGDRPRKTYARGDDARSSGGRSDRPRSRGPRDERTGTGERRTYERSAERSPRERPTERRSFDKPAERRGAFDKPAERRPRERSVSYKTRDGMTTATVTKAGPERSARTKPSYVSGPRPNLFGQHAVREAWLNPKRSIHAIYLTEDAAKVFESWPSPKVDRPMPIAVHKDDLDRMLNRREDGPAVHQGFAISAAPLEDVFVQDLISRGLAADRSVILVLDQVTDPHNVGAILRSASAFGAHGVVMQKRHAPDLEGIVSKTASGAIDHLPVAYETNLSRALEELKDSGYAVIGLDEHAPQTLSELKVPQRAVLVLGNEGEGMRRLVREHCDHLVTLPTQKPINSLNVSNAAAVALYALSAK